MKKLIFIVALLFSVTVFAEDLDTSDLPWMERIESTSTWTLLIEKLNTEFDRITHNNSLEYVDLITNETIDLIMWSMQQQNTDELSEEELRNGLSDNVMNNLSTMGELEEYTNKQTDERKAYFENCLSFVGTFIIMD